MKKHKTETITESIFKQVIILGSKFLIFSLAYLQLQSHLVLPDLTVGNVVMIILIAKVLFDWKNTVNHE
jgi:hypothetical protein